MNTEQQYFEQSPTLAQYIEQMTANKSEMKEIYDRFQVPADDLFIELLRERKPHVLAIAEDWCGDAMLNVAVLGKIADAAHVEVRVAPRDEDPNLIDQHLTNGARSIPIFLLLDTDGLLIAKWGPRAEKVDAYVQEARKHLPAKEDPSYEKENKTVLANMLAEFKNNPDRAVQVYEEIRTRWLPALQRITA